MRKLSILLLASVVLSIWCSGASAARCAGITSPLYCDDFDRWCSPPPTDPQAACTSLDAVDQAGFSLSWLLENQCVGDWAPHQLSTSSSKSFKSEGYGVEVTTHNGSGPIFLVRQTHDLTPEILNDPRNTSNQASINGAGVILSRYLTYPNTNPEYVDAMDRTLSPDTLKGQFWVNLGTCGHYSQMLYFTELSLDDDHAPVNFTTTQCNYWVDCNCDALHPGSPGCATGEQATCSGGDLAGMPCSTDAQCSVGPTRQVLQAGDGQVHASFAIGLMPLVDGTPCYEGGTAWPQAMWRLMVFDGLSWQQFQAPKFGIPMTPGNIQPDTWDLRPWDGWNYIQFAIGTDYIEVRLRNARSEAYNATTKCIMDCDKKKCVGGQLNGAECTTDAFCNDLSDLPPGVTQPPALPQPYFVARVPRQYLGPFNKISAGPSQGLDTTTTPTCVNYGTVEQPWKRCRGGENSNLACETDQDCPASTTEVCLKTFQRAWDVGLDEVVLYDGVFEALGSACCTCTDIGCSCQILDETECLALGGTFYSGQKCNQVQCCPNPFADADADGDVDQNDFSFFQRCFTGPGTFTLSSFCQCFDRTDSTGSGPPDSAVDSNDWSKFEACSSGPGVAADPACDGAP